MPECLDNFPWRSLKGCGEMAPAMFKVGDFKNDRLKDGTPAQFRIIGFKHDRTSSGIVLPMTWEMVDCMPNHCPWNRRDTAEGSWGSTYLRHEMNNEQGSIFKLLPDEIIEVAVPVIKLTADTFSGENNIIETEDLFWIKSEKETYGRNIISAPGEGHWYEWYRQEDNPWYKTRHGDGEYTMLRSPRLGSRSSFCVVNSNGIAYYGYASNAYGVAPAFSF